MEVINKKDYSIFRSLSDTMMRFISKEGCNQFPTVVFLLNRMFVSDAINLIQDLNITNKLKKGDNLYWYKDKNVVNQFTTVMNSIFSNPSTFVFKKYSNSKSFNKIFTINATENYFVMPDNSLSYGTCENNSNVNVSLTEDIKSLDRIKPGLDYILTAHSLYFINPSTKEVKLKYEDTSNTFNDITKTSDKLVLATNNGGLVFDNISFDGELNLINTLKIDRYDIVFENGDGNEGSVTKSKIVSGTNIYELAKQLSNIGYEISDISENGVVLPKDYTIKKDMTVSCTWKSVVESSSSPSSAPTVPLKDNGMPFNNSVDRCVIIGGYIYIGTNTNCTKFSLTDTSDHGVDAKEELIEYHSNSSSKELYKLKPNDYKINSNSYKVDFTPNGFCESTDILFIYNSSKIYSYSKSKQDKKIEFNFSGIKNVLCDDKTIICLTSSNETYEIIRGTDEDFPAITIPFLFEFSKDKSIKKLNCSKVKMDTYEILKTIILEQSFTKYLMVEGKLANFVTIINGINYYIFGNDDRNKIAKELKSISDAFDIGI